VRLDAPLNGQKFPGPTNIVLRAYAQDLEDGYDLTVEFFEFTFGEGTKSLGFGAFVPTRCATYCPYFELTWSNVPPGTYDLTAIATDRSGLSSSSNPGLALSHVHITVFDRNHPPGVNIYATDPVATEQPATTANAPDTATFTVRRDNTNGSIVVYYNISGTASNGVDYEKLSGQVTMLEGESSAEIVVTPIDDDLVEGTETVELTLIPPCPFCLFATPPCYVAVPIGQTNCYPIGPNNKAVAYIRDNDTVLNAIPHVVITQPTNREVFVAPSKITIEVAVTDPDGYATHVDFFANGRKIGEETIAFIIAPPPGQTMIFSFDWTNALPGVSLPGLYDLVELVARATDDLGGVGSSAPVLISVTNTNFPPPVPTVVTVVATDPDAEEIPVVPPGMGMPQRVNPAVFTVSRSGNTNGPLTVYFRLSGTASNGVDYDKVGDSVTIPDGASSADVIIYPIDDFIVEGTETVVLTLEPLGCFLIYPDSLRCPSIGSPGRAVAYIRDNDGNLPPEVNIYATDPIATEEPATTARAPDTATGESN